MHRFAVSASNLLAWEALSPGAKLMRRSVLKGRTVDSEDLLLPIAQGTGGKNTYCGGPLGHLKSDLKPPILGRVAPSDLEKSFNWLDPI